MGKCGVRERATASAMERWIWNSSEEETPGEVCVDRLVGKKQRQEVGVLAYQARWLSFRGEMEERAFARAGLRRMVMEV